MSKYIKLDDAISKIVNTPTRVITDDLTALADRQHEIIDMLSDLPTIEVSEDAINRATALEIYSDLYWIDERLLNFKSELDKVYDELRNAPSVVPKPKEGEWIRHCPNCHAKMKGAE